MSKDEIKTNVMRVLEQSKIEYTSYSYTPTGTITGLEAANSLGKDPEHVFKTLVTVGKSGDHFIFVIPVCYELDLKKAAKSIGEKSVEMIKSKDLLSVTGYIHGGCSPIGMKKQFKTVIHETAVLYDTILFSAGKIGVQVELSPNALATLINAEFFDICVS